MVKLGKAAKYGGGELEPSDRRAWEGGSTVGVAFWACRGEAAGIKRQPLIMCGRICVVGH